MPNENPKKTKSAPKRPARWQSLVVGLLLVSVGGWIVFRTLSTHTPRVKIGGSTIIVEVADETEEITRGLSGRAALAPNAGMLFIFEQPLVPAFWMKDMQFPIDVIWINEDLEIIAISPSVPVESYPDTISPPEPVKYVLEVNAGLSANRAWYPGATVELNL